MNYYGPAEEMIIAQTMTFIMTMIFACLLSVASQILLAFATYNDAKARGNSDPVMWALLVGILGWIPGIVYLCLRNNAANRLMTCAKCGFTHRIAEPFCPQCRSENPYSAPFYSPLAPRQAHNAKLLLIWGIVAFAAAIVLMVIGVVALVNGMIMAGAY
ncbi:hypothetical protein [Clostridium sp. D33t1_170424_F3]|uniref:hypothetical protein n=1 Tax=Clostridium sp. D33t1_170424_F3 TaxID=2787099 RepID=UPI0018ABFADC|nr:hypothetical protein [Clostridium sp. D33t1_170424_F3]